MLSLMRRRCLFSDNLNRKTQQLHKNIKLSFFQYCLHNDYGSFIISGQDLKAQ